MKINTKIRYGLRMLVRLAQSSRVINTAELGDHMKVSPKYLRKLAGPMEKAGLIKSVQGIHGGYSLNKPASDISIHMVFAAFGEGVRLSNCLKTSRCPLFDECLVRPVWSYLERVLEDEFFNITVSDVISGSFGDVRAL